MGRTRTNRKSPPQSIKAEGSWLQSLHIRNFRGIRDLEVTGLAPITVFTGDNGSGKTTLLNACFAVHSRMNPDWITRYGDALGIRGAVSAGPSYLGLFYGYADVGETVISAMCANHSRVGVRIRRSLDSGSVVVPRKGSLDTAIHAVPEVVCEALSGNKVERESKIRWRMHDERRGELVLENAKGVHPRAVFVHPDQGPADEEEEQLFGDIKREPVRFRNLIETLKRVNPSVDDVDFSRTSNDQCFSARLADGRWVPFGALGSGINIVLRYLIYAETARDGFLAIDEVGQGIYYRRQGDIFTQLFAVARTANMQLMLTSHSSEAVAAMVEAASDGQLDNFAVVHVRREENDDVRATVIPGPRAKSSLISGYDLR